MRISDWSSDVCSSDLGPGQSRRLREASVEPLAFAATPNDFIRSVAGQPPHGLFPLGFSGEQPYWTIVGVDAGSDQGLNGEDGAVEVSRGGFPIEPFVVHGDSLRSISRPVVKERVSQFRSPWVAHAYKKTNIHF